MTKHTAANSNRRPARLTKKATLEKLLRGKTGADLSTLTERLGWQPHTTRAAISRLRKEGMVIVGAVPPKGGAARYRIVSAEKAHGA